MESKTLLIFDWSVTESNAIFRGLKRKIPNLQLRGTKQIIPNSKLNKLRFILHYLKFCCGLINETSTKDILVFRLDMMAIISWWIASLTCRKRNILCINIMLKESTGFKGLVTRFLYKHPLASCSFKATVTSAYFGRKIREYLQLPNPNEANELFVLNDDCGNIAGLERPFVDKGNTVFCGGNNGRDWKLVLRVANKMPTVSFKVVMPKGTYDSYEGKVPSNVSLFTRLSSSEFFELQSECSITFLPLSTQAPAGLIVVFSAALMQKMIVISDTICSREYIDDEISGLLGTTEEEFVSAIQKGLENLKLRKKLGEQACLKIKNVGSPETYINKLSSYIKSYDNCN